MNSVQQATKLIKKILNLYWKNKTNDAGSDDEEEESEANNISTTKGEEIYFRNIFKGPVNQT